MSGRIRIGTRGSHLALWQANETARKLTNAGFAPEIVPIKTTGDKRQDVSLASVGGKGVFIKEIEEALERGEIDMAVHSLKDVPSILPPQFTLAGFLERGDPRDAWVHPHGVAIADLPAGSKIGTSAPRRRAQILEKFPRLTVEPIRGNVETRIGKARAGQYAGVILASAGLQRLGREREATSVFSVDDMIPAAGQGIIVIETMASNGDARDHAGSITDRASELAAMCERGVLQKFGAHLDCYSAVAVHATTYGGNVTIRAFAADDHGIRAIRVRRSGRDPVDVITAVYDELIANGAMELLNAEPATGNR